MRINDTDENRLSQTDRTKGQFGYPWVSILGLRTRFQLRRAIDSLKIGPRPRPVPRRQTMTDPAAGAPGDQSLQFDHVERAGQTPGMACSICQRPIAASYYEINGKVTCLGCRGQIMAAWNRGSSAQRFAKALGLGAAAAALGAGVYFGIEALTGYELGLVAGLVRLLVGAAVRKGSSGRGGWRYQLLAMFLTYSAVVATDSTLIARELRKELQARSDSAGVAFDSGGRRAASPAAAAAPANTAATTGHARARPLALLFGIAFLLALAYAAPIIIGFSSPLHLLIAGFALYEAWKLNRGVALRVTGPYQASRPVPG